MEKNSYLGFRSNLRPSECTQITNSDEDLLWDAADNPINYCLNDLKKLPDAVQNTNKRSLQLNKIFIKIFPVKKIHENRLIFGFQSQVPPFKKYLHFSNCISSQK